LGSPPDGGHNWSPLLRVSSCPKMSVDWETAVCPCPPTALGVVRPT
jgi:hypothetical protein